MVLFGSHVEEFMVLFGSHVEEFMVLFMVLFGSHFGEFIVPFGSHVEEFVEANLFGIPGVVVGFMDIIVLFGVRLVLLSKTKHVGDTVVVVVRTVPIELFVKPVTNK